LDDTKTVSSNNNDKNYEQNNGFGRFGDVDDTLHINGKEETMLYCSHCDLFLFKLWRKKLLDIRLILIHASRHNQPNKAANIYKRSVVAHIYSSSHIFSFNKQDLTEVR
jgi:hypothetical protein